MDGATRPK